MIESCMAGSSYRKILPVLTLCVFLPGFQVFAQAETRNREELWICPGGEIARYSISNFAYGGSFALGYGNGAAIGLKGAFYADNSGVVTTVELSFLFRLYFFGSASYAGPYAELSGGPALFTKSGGLKLPSKWGSVTGGIGLGWRFNLGRFWFLDGSVRGGYPYIAGAGLSFGLRF